jgi:hypothetical protein
MGKHRSLDDIPWERFDAAAVDAEVVKRSRPPPWSSATAPTT